MPETRNGKKYFLLLVDDRSQYMWVAMLSSKDRAVDAIKEIKARADSESGRKLGALPTNRGGEFTTHEFAEYCTRDGIHRQRTAPYNAQQNGVVEQRNGTVVAAARSMLKVKGLLGRLWGEVVATAVYLLNRCPTKSVEGMTPFQAWHGKKPAVHNLRIFGCIAHVRNTSSHLKKLEDKSRKMIFIGYEAGSKAYRAYNPTTNCVHVSRDIVFDEAAQWDWDSDTEKQVSSGHGDVFTVEYAVENLTTSKLDGTPEVSNDGAMGPEPMSAPSEISSRGAMENQRREREVEFATPPSVQSDHMDADHGDAPLRFRKIDNIIGLTSPRGPASRVLIAEELHEVSADELVSFDEAECHPS